MELLCTLPKYPQTARWFTLVDDFGVGFKELMQLLRDLQKRNFDIVFSTKDGVSIPPTGWARAVDQANKYWDKVNDGEKVKRRYNTTPTKARLGNP
tara:strand:- start:3708 stop:3995 length:288 start_codon:yes stop_codon:yes gene_type:complete